MLLIYPPAAKPCEPPAGIAKLSGALAHYGIRHRVLDANIGGLSFFLHQPQVRFDTWTNRAFRNLTRNLRALKNRQTYSTIARYKRAVTDVNRVVWASSSEGNETPGLANYQHKKLSPLRSADLLYAAEHPENNIYYPYFSRRLTEIIEQEQPKFVGFSLNYLSQALCTFAMTGFLKREAPKTKIILGGGLVTSWMRNGRPENLFQGLVEHFVSGPGEYDLLAMHGISRSERKHFTPEYDLLLSDDYLAPQNILPYSGSSGCYWNRCSFCPEKAEQNPFSAVPAKEGRKDLQILTAKTKAALIHMLDSSMTTGFMKELINNAPGVPWYGFARVSRELADHDFCMGLKQSGCVMLKLGIESGDQGVLDALHKGIDLSTASNALKMLKKSGIATYVYLIFGTPAETESSAQKTLAFTVKHNESIDFLNLAIFNMPVCGAAASGLRTKGFSEGDLSLYTDFHHPDGWDRKRVRLFLDRTFKTHPAVSSILMNDPPVFTSNHAPFFVMNRERAKQF